MIELESERLRIREIVPDDLPALLPVYLSNPQFVAWSEGSQGEAGYYDLAMLQRDWQVAQMMPGRVMLGIYLKATGEAVGQADYLAENPDDGLPWLGLLMIAGSHQRRGRACASASWSRIRQPPPSGKRRASSAFRAQEASIATAFQPSQWSGRYNSASSDILFRRRES
jgi:hypothetical protein